MNNVFADVSSKNIILKKIIRNPMETIITKFDLSIIYNN